MFVNAVLPDRLSGAERNAIEELAARPGAARDLEGESRAHGPPHPSPAALSALEAALAADRTARAQRSQLGRLRRGLTTKATTLPHLLTPDVDRNGLDRLATKLERGL